MPQPKKNNSSEPHSLGSLCYVLYAFCVFTAQLINSAAIAAIHSVGPNQAYAEIQDVPWENLNAGDIVEIHWRATPYQSKWVVARSGNASEPITIRGIEKCER